jgi:aspartate/methionine/tyrosine aminotransferase
MNPAIEATGGSIIRALHGKRRPTSINLGLGEPSLMPDVAHFERATAWVAEHGCRYSTNIGDADLRAAIAAHYAYPALDRADNVCITTGSQEAVYVALRTLLDPARDEVLVVEPAFPVYAKIAQVEGIPCRRLALDPSGPEAFDPDRILEAVGPQTRMIVIGSPSNPTGRVITKAATKKIADGLLARGGPPVYVMHDEIYRELIYTDDAGEFGKVYPYTVAVNSLSKSNALTGLRLGWMIAPLDVMPHLVKFHGWVTSCASTFAQRVAHEIFAANELAVARPWYAAQRDGALAIAREIGLDFIEPEGAFYLCVRVGAADTLAFAEQLLVDRDVVAIPAHIFSPILTGWLRTSFVGPLADIREGLERIAAEALEQGTLRAKS